MQAIISYFTLLNLICICLALEKGCRMSQLDAKMKPLTSMASDGNWPENEQATNRWCSSTAKDLSQMRDFMKKCVKAEAKSILSVTLHAMERLSLKTYCKNKVERNKLMKAAKCINSDTKPTVKCWTGMVSRMTAISNTTINKEKIPMLCCSMLRWKDCVMAAYEDKRRPDCSGTEIEFIDQYTYKSTIEPLNIFCTDFDESDKCKKFESFLVKNSGNRIKYSTPFPAIIDVFENL